jgi:tRNA1(Val) A37 N6-methylase TrmN6
VTQEAAEASASYTADLFLGGLVKLIQPVGGHRAGLDAALLQALVPADATGRAVDLGAGAGAVAFALAARASRLSVIGVERDPALVAYGRAALEEIENAGFASRVRLLEADVTGKPAALSAAGLEEESADWVLMNPPFDISGAVRESPDTARRGAHVAGADALSAWCGTAARLLNAKGRIALIHRAQALPRVLAAMEGRFGDVRVRPVHPHEEEPASRILVRAVRGSRAGISLLPGLVLHRPGGAWTPEAEAILRGRAELSA